MDLFFFSRSINNFMVDLIKRDENIVCKGELDSGYVKSEASYCNSGYGYINSDKKILYGFCMFSKYDENHNILQINVLCSNNKVGSLLLIKSIEYAKNNNYIGCILEAKNKNNLPRYYEKFLFEEIDSYINFNGIKCSIMYLDNFNILDNYNLNDSKFGEILHNYV